MFNISNSLTNYKKTQISLDDVEINRPIYKGLAYIYETY